MNNSHKLEKFLKGYEQYVSSVLIPSRDELKKILKGWRQVEFWAKYSRDKRLPDPSPIQRFEIRIKRPESVVDKVSRKPYDYPDGLTSNAFHRMHDALGARAVIYFNSQFPLIHEELCSPSSPLEISTKYPPVAYLDEPLLKHLRLDQVVRYDKDSGYAAMHYHVRLKESSVPEVDRPWIELQVRTLAEDIWAAIEHLLGYKTHKKTSFPVTRQFQILSKQLSAIDEHFNFLFEELTRFQAQATLSVSDPLNAENLPSVLSEIGLSCSQHEVSGMLKILASRHVATVGDFQRLATSDRIKNVVAIYRTDKDAIPTNFEVVAQLANLSSSSGDKVEEAELIRAQIKLLEAWDNIKKGL